ncbi:MAG TPA: hypothetical protein VI750_13915 [Pyrinomonadaceae bacterium]|nr:hypothetical protein [Pyrinomonadaceae bacterium]
MLLLRALKDFILCWFVVAFLAGIAFSIQAQSLDARSPSPVRTNEVVGRIGARDIGDARLTDHFYSLTGAPGDLLITIETRNLNGDIDIFTAGALRPVLKFALYAEVTAPVTKSIYLRQREDLILRIEARSPNDDAGTYHLRFGGSFEPVAAMAENDEASPGEETAIALPATRKGKRVSSVGARIEAAVPPPLEVAEAPMPEPSPSALVDPHPEAARPVEPATAEPKAAETVVEATPIPSVRSARGRASTRRGRSSAPKREETSTKPVAEEVSKKEEPVKREPVKQISEKPLASARRSSKKSRSVTTEPVERAEAASSDRPSGTKEAAPAKTEPRPSEANEPSTAKTEPSAPERSAEATQPTQPEDLSKSKLIIEMLDGTRLERFMNTVRRVDVESGQIVVTATDGTVQRIRLSRVVRMSIGSH